MFAMAAMTLNTYTGLRPPTIPSTKPVACARDLVAPCRNCNTVVCRNCAAKPPSDRCLPDRFRRLCRACLSAPLPAHLQPRGKPKDNHESPPGSSASSTRSDRSVSNSSTISHITDTDVPELQEKEKFTASAFLRDPCTCATRGVYLCAPCGQSLRTDDTLYKRVWTWRSRYSTHIGGGLGTGLGQGDQGQKCGRGKLCLEDGADGVCWVETDCSNDKTEVKAQTRSAATNRSKREIVLQEGDGGGYHCNKAGYLNQEIEGIGGTVKMKARKRVKVGATVWEFDDERETGKYLGREASGLLRSWCGWCDRVVLAAQSGG